MKDRIEGLNNMALAALVIGAIGGLLALVPAVTALLDGRGAWAQPLVLALLAALALVAVVYGAGRTPLVGGLGAIVLGLVLVVTGPPTAGVLVAVAGAMLFIAGRTRPSHVGVPSATTQTRQP